MPGQRYAHRYKFGKQLELLDFKDIVELVKKARLCLEHEAYFWLLYYCGVRKSEAYERVAEDFKVTETHLIIDFHKRKKGGETVPPLKIPRHWYGVDKIETCLNRSLFTRSGQEKKPRSKNVFVQENKKRVKVRQKGLWVFPHIQSTTAWMLIKKVLGQNYYPHFLRLNRLTVIGSDPTSNVVRLKSFSGIKTLKALQFYLGVSEKEQDAAMDYEEKRMAS